MKIFAGPKRRIAVLCLILPALFAACQKTRDPDTLVVGLEGNPVSLDPRYAVDAYSTRILPLIFDRFLETGPDGDVRPGLAESWEIENDVRYTFHLRSGVRFSDGSPLTSRDVAENVRFLRDPENKCPAGGSLDIIETIETPDAETVIIKLKEVFAPFMQKLALGVVPASLLGDGDFGDHPVGSGPYVLEKFQRGFVLELIPNENYNGPPPSIPRIRFEVLPNETTRMLKMKKGDIDLMQNCTPPYALKKFAAMKGVAVDRAPGINYSYMGFNMQDPKGIVSNKAVRAAVAHAIDREAIIDRLLKGQARVADTLLAPENWAHNPDVPVFDYDPEKARDLLDRAGFRDPDGDGPQMRFTLSYKTSTDRLRNRIAEVMAAQLADVGIGLEKRSYEWGTFFADVKKGNFQAYTLSWVGVMDPDHLFYVFHSSSMPPSGANRGRYANPELDALLEKARLITNTRRRRDLYLQAQKIIAEDAVYLSLWWTDSIIVRSERLRGFVPYPGGEYTSLAAATLEER